MTILTMPLKLCQTTEALKMAENQGFGARNDILGDQKNKEINW
jgi:hypothetical protein